VLESGEIDLFRSMTIIGIILGLSCISANAQIDRISVADGGVEANGGSDQPAVSDNGQVIAFRSNASNLVAGDTNGWSDVFVRNLSAGTTAIVSLQPDGSETPDFSSRPSISDHGRFVAFEGKSPVNNQIQAALADLQNGTVVHLLPREENNVPVPAHQAQVELEISGNGQFVGLRSRDTFSDVWPPSIRPPADDQNSAFDVFVYDRVTAPTPALERISRDSAGSGSDADSRRPALSDDGRIVAFMSYSEILSSDGNNRPDIFVKDRQTGVLERISSPDGVVVADGASFNPAVSADADVVAFRSEASNLVSGDSNGRWDIFARVRSSATTERISVASDGAQANHNSLEASVSDDGRFVTFRSMASNLVAGDNNRRDDIFVHDRVEDLTARVGQPPGGESNGHSANPKISGDGAWIVFVSEASNLVPGDDNASRDVFRAPNPLFATREGE